MWKLLEWNHVSYPSLVFNETSYPQTKFVTTVYFTIEYFRLKSLLSNLRIHCTVETLPVSLAIKSKLISNRSLIIPSRPMSNIHCIANMKYRFGIYVRYICSVYGYFFSILTYWVDRTSNFSFLMMTLYILISMKANLIETVGLKPIFKQQIPPYIQNIYWSDYYTYAAFWNVFSDSISSSKM